MDQHPLSAMFPALSAEEYESLRKNIQQIGVQNPIIVHEDMVLDGWHRYRACKELGIEPPLTTATGDLGDLVLAGNIHRRHLPAMTRAALVAKVREWRSPGGSGHSLKSRNDNLTADEMAAEAGTSRSTVEAAKRQIREYQPTTDLDKWYVGLMDTELLPPAVDVRPSDGAEERPAWEAREHTRVAYEDWCDLTPAEKEEIKEKVEQSPDHYALPYLTKEHDPEPDEDADNDAHIEWTKRHRLRLLVPDTPQPAGDNRPDDVFTNDGPLDDDEYDEDEYDAPTPPPSKPKSRGTTKPKPKPKVDKTKELLARCQETVRARDERIQELEAENLELEAEIRRLTAANEALKGDGKNGSEWSKINSIIEQNKSLTKSRNEYQTECGRLQREIKALRKGE